MPRKPMHSHAASPTPWYKENPFWGSFGTFLAFYLSGLTSRLTGNPSLGTWLLWIALPWGIIAAWCALKDATSIRRRISYLVGASLAVVCMIELTQRFTSASSSQTPVVAEKASAQRVSDPLYPRPSNKLVRVDGDTPLASGILCPTSMPDQDRISCLCPNLVPYRLEALPTPPSDNYATLLTLDGPRQPIYKVRLFFRDVFSHSEVVYPTSEMAKMYHFSFGQVSMDYDRYSLVVQSTAPQQSFKLKMFSSTGLRVICANQIN